MRRIPINGNIWVVRKLFFVLYWCCPLLWFGKYKIGISYQTSKRRRDIDNDLPGGIVTVLAVRVLKAEKKESLLHRMYKPKNYRPRKAGKSAGKSEHFNLSLFDILVIKSIYLFFFVVSNIVGTMCLSFIFFVVWRNVFM